MTIIVPFVLAHMASVRAESKGEMAPLQEQASSHSGPPEFGKVLTRILGDSAKPEIESEEQETGHVLLKHRKQIESEANWVSLSTALGLPAGQAVVTKEAELIVQVQGSVEVSVPNVELSQQQPLSDMMLDVPTQLPPQEESSELETAMPMGTEELPREPVPRPPEPKAQLAPKLAVEEELPEQAVPKPPETEVQQAQKPAMDVEPQEQEIQTVAVQDYVTVPSESQMLAVEEEPWQPTLRTLRGAKSELPAMETQQYTLETEVDAEKLVLPEGETSSEEIESDFKPEPSLKQDMGPETFAISENPRHEVITVAPREVLDRTQQIEEPSEVLEEPDNIVETKSVVHEKMDAEKGQEFTSQQRQSPEETVAVHKNIPRDRPTHERSEVAFPADLRMGEPVAESSGPEPQIRAVLDFHDRDNLFPRLVQSMESLVQEERSEVRIQLKPDHLGELKIKLSMERGIMVAEFVVQDQAVREVIASQLPQLQTALQNQGTQIADVSVSIGLGDKGPGGEGQPKPKQPSQKGAARLQKASVASGERAYLGRSIWNQVDVKV